MEIKSIVTAVVKDWAKDLVLLKFRREIQVYKEVLSYTLLSLVAEVALLL